MILQALMQILADRMILLLSLFLTFSLFCWAMYEPENNRLILAFSFALSVFLPVLFSQGRKENVRRVQEENQPT
jgi:hypothetical protein